MLHKKFFLLLISSMLFAPLANATVYASAGGGITEGRLKYTVVEPEEDSTIARQYDGALNGMGQVGIGFSQEWGHFVGGLEAGFEWHGFESDNAITITILSENETRVSSTSTRLKNDYYLHLKPGYLVKDAFIVYGLAGIMRGSFTYSDVTGDLGSHPGPEHHTMKTGYRVGFGIANKVKNHWEWRAEYTLNGYGDIQSQLTDIHDTSPTFFKRSHIAINQLLLGVGYHF